MKIGILTFHWATNYGAVLQCYALQAYLERMGHSVEVVNYKPSQFDNTIYNFLRYRKFLRYKAYKYSCAKEQKLESFRSKYLNRTVRFQKETELFEATTKYDLLITGSDQVLNPSFLNNGEKRGSTAYYLGFTNLVKKISYAVSFGCTEYPCELHNKIKELLSSFDAHSVRESTGKTIIDNLGIVGAVVVPDPTLLLCAEMYKKFVKTTKIDSYFAYILQNQEVHIKRISSELNIKIHLSINESLERWLSNIHNSLGIITNSFHCVVFSLLFHKEFVVVLNTKENIGMNDRFYTLLSECGLEDRITTFQDYDKSILTKSIDWEKVESNIESMRTIGKQFLRLNLK